jgi:very-short-patch-repair endonuclease
MISKIYRSKAILDKAQRRTLRGFGPASWKPTPIRIVPTPDDEKVRFANHMRQSPTSLERLLFRYLDAQLGPQYYRKQEILFGFIVDAFHAESNTAFEVDGPLHIEAKDQIRDNILLRHGIRTIRFTAHELSNLPQIVSEIIRLETRKKSTLP